MNPVCCNFCGQKYDLGLVKVIARYADATVFKTPCCRRTADDREWKQLPDFTRVSGQLVLTADGLLIHV